MGVNPFKSSGGDIPTRAKSLVLNYIIENSPASEQDILLETEVFVVWFVKVLQNWKALVSTSTPDGKYYEITHDGENAATYVDIYQKVDHFEILDKRKDR